MGGGGWWAPAWVFAFSGLLASLVLCSFLLFLGRWAVEVGKLRAMLAYRLVLAGAWGSW